jgi:hypothetical protein
MGLGERSTGGKPAGMIAPDESARDGRTLARIEH